MSRLASRAVQYVEGKLAVVCVCVCVCACVFAQLALADSADSSVPVRIADRHDSRRGCWLLRQMIIRLQVPLLGLQD